MRSGSSSVARIYRGKIGNGGFGDLCPSFVVLDSILILCIKN